MLAKNHFEECPYHCNDNGMLLDTNTGSLVQCPYCSKKKKELLAQGYVEADSETPVSLGDVVGISSDFLSTKFVYESTIPDGEKLFITPESLEMQKEIADNLYLGLTVGQLPEFSMCFGISIKGRIDRFVYPMLAKAYLSNLSIGKFMSCTEFSRLGVDANNKDIDEMYTCDFLVMLLNDGATLADFASAKGLMQSRGIKGKPTIFVTTWTIEACSGLLGFADEPSYFMAKPVFLEYKKGKGKHTKYINNLVGVENDRAMGEAPKVSMGDLISGDF